MLFLYIISLKVSRQSSFLEAYTYIASFGFEKQGSVSIDIETAPLNSSLSRNISVLLATDAEKGQILASSPSCSDHLAKINFSMPAFEASTNKTFAVVADGVYYVYIIPCCQFFSAKFTVNAIFKNPNTYLDSRYKGGMQAKPATLAISVISLLAWASLFAIFHRRLLMVHWLLLSLSLLYALFLTFSFLDVFYEDKGSSIFSAPSTALSSVCDVLLFAYMLIASSGYCLCRGAEPLKSVPLALLYSFAYEFAPMLLGVFEFGNYAFTMYIVCGLALIMMIRSVWRSTEEARLRVRGHLYAIENDGIDSFSTPIYKKYRLILWMRISYIAVFLLITLYNYTVALWTAGWVVDLGRALIFQISLSLIQYFYRARGEAIDALFEADTGIAPQKIRIGDLRSIDLKTFRGEDLRSYINGMILPREPEIILGRLGTGSLMSMESSYDVAAA